MGARICAVAVAAFGRPLLHRSLPVRRHPKRDKLRKKFHFILNFSLPSTTPSISAYILSVRPGSARPTPALLLRPRSTILPFALPLDRQALVLSRLRLVAGPRAAREEPSTEAAFVGRVPAPFDWDATWPGDVGCFRALRANEGEAGFE